MRTRHSCLVLLALGVASVLIACAGSQTSLGASKSAVPHWNAWLCFPGSATDWCNVVLATKIVGANGSVKNLTVPVAADPRVDCFYLYPTVSQQHRGNSTLAVGAAERTIAIVQAAEFSRVCRVFAPMYRQVTVSAGTCVAGRCIPPGNGAYEYDDVLAAWRDYMARYNDGRGVILIGHSEGSYLFQDLLQNVIERSAERKQIVSAILLGGAIAVAMACSIVVPPSHTFIVRSRVRIPRTADAQQRTVANRRRQGRTRSHSLERVDGPRINSGCRAVRNTIPSNRPGLPFPRPKRLVRPVAVPRPSFRNEPQPPRHVIAISTKCDPLPINYPQITR